MKRIFIAGPYTSPDPAANTSAAMKAWPELERAAFFARAWQVPGRIRRALGWALRTLRCQP